MLCDSETEGCRSVHAVGSSIASQGDVISTGDGALGTRQLQELDAQDSEGRGPQGRVSGTVGFKLNWKGMHRSGLLALL